MATTHEKKADNPFSSYYETAETQAKQFLGWQFKTSQEIMDQGLKLSQTWGEYSQELLKTGLQAAETLKKTMAPILEKTHSAFTK